MPRSASLFKAAPFRPRRAGWPARVAAFGGVLAVLLQAALPIAHQAAMALPDGRYADYRSAFGAVSDHALCVIDAAASGDDRPVKPEPSEQQPPCPLCLAALHAPGWLPPLGVAAPVPTQAAESIAIMAVTAGRPVATESDAQARAPPRLI
jgi:hypothetical protein